MPALFTDCDNIYCIVVSCDYFHTTTFNSENISLFPEQVFGMLWHVYFYQIKGNKTETICFSTAVKSPILVKPLISPIPRKHGWRCCGLDTKLTQNHCFLASDMVSPGSNKIVPWIYLEYQQIYLNLFVDHIKMLSC